MRRLLALLSLFLAIQILAVAPTFWEVRTNDDFRKGTLNNLSLTSEDRLVLAPRFDAVFSTGEPFVWSAASDSRGNVYLGTGHGGKVFRVEPSGSGALLADFPELDVFAVAVDSKDAVYAATSPEGKVYRIGPGGEPQVFFDPEDKYIWALVFDRQGRLIVATGDKGVLYRVEPDRRAETFYDTDETHVISLAVDGAGNILAGGDPKGYLYRISPDGRAFVLHDSDMREVHAVTVAPNGAIYAAVVQSRDGVSSLSSEPATSSGSASGGGIIVTLSAESAAAQSIGVIDSPSAGSTISPSTTSSSSGGSAQSAIVEVLPDGVVNTIWRSSSEMVYGLLPRGGNLLFSTGSKGRIYSLDSARKVTLLVESTEEQTTRLMQAGSRIYAASANAGKLFSLSDMPAASGSYESDVRDTNAISSWGKVSWKAENPQLVQVFTRTGNTSTPDKTWSDWTRVANDGTSDSPKARFLQWRAVLRSDGGRTPSLGAVTVPYLQQNFRPEVTALEVVPFGVALVKVQPLTATGSPAGPQDTATARVTARAGLPGVIRTPPRRVIQKGAQSFQWTATDKNQDLLQYDLYYRGESESNWIPLKRDVEDNFYTIDSDTLPDGVYVVRLVVSDTLSNAAEGALAGERVSAPFTIDNTPPTVTMRQEGISDRRVRIAIEASDLTSTLNQAEVSTDAGPWRAVFPQDGIPDSKDESFEYRSEALSPGEHVIAFRVFDTNDNVGMAKLVVRIP